jgi:hypothetical protein
VNELVLEDPEGGDGIYLFWLENWYFIDWYEQNTAIKIELKQS